MQRYFWILKYGNCRLPIQFGLLLILCQIIVSCSHLPPIPPSVTFNSTQPRWSWTGTWKGDGGSIINIVQQGNAWTTSGEVSASATLVDNHAIGSAKGTILPRNFDYQMSDDGMWANGTVTIGSQTIPNTKLMRISGAPHPLSDEEALALKPTIQKTIGGISTQAITEQTQSSNSIHEPPAGLYRGYQNKMMGLPDTGMNIVLDGNGNYTDGVHLNNIGHYTFNPANQNVSFVDGPWNGLIADLQINPKRIRLQPTDGQGSGMAGMGKWWFDLDMKTTTVSLPHAVVPDLTSIDPASHIFTVDEIVTLNDSDRFNFLSRLQGHPISVRGLVSNFKMPSRYFSGMIWLESETYPGGKLSFDSGRKFIPTILMQVQKGQAVTLLGVVNNSNKNIVNHVFFDLLDGKLEQH